MNGVQISDDDESERLPGLIFYRFSAKLFVLSACAQKMKCRTFQGLSIDIKLVSNAIQTSQLGIFKSQDSLNVTVTEDGARVSFCEFAAKRLLLQTRVKLQKCRNFKGLSNGIRYVYNQTITLSVRIFKQNLLNSESSNDGTTVSFCKFSTKRLILAQRDQKVKCKAFQELSISI